MKLLSAFFLFIPFTVFAGEILLDTGKTISATPYRIDHGIQYPAAPRPSVGGLISPRTPEMTLGKVQTRAINLPYLPSPFFLVGTDPTSIAWLGHHSNALKKAGAKGIIVNSDSPENLKKLIKAANGVHVSPASATEIAKRFKLRHYPVLITRKQIAQ